MQRLECGCSVEVLQVLAHVAGVKAVVCHSVLGLCGCVYAKIGTKALEKQNARVVVDPLQALTLAPLASLQDARGITRRRSGPGSAPELIRSLLSTAVLATTQTQTTQIAQQIGAPCDEGGEATSVPEALADGGPPVPLIPPPAPKDAHFLRFRPPTKIPLQARPAGRLTTRGASNPDNVWACQNHKDRTAEGSPRPASTRTTRPR